MQTFQQPSYYAIELAKQQREKVKQKKEEKKGGGGSAWEWCR